MIWVAARYGTCTMLTAPCCLSNSPPRCSEVPTPEVAPLASSVPAWKGADVTVWQGVFAPKGTPPEVVAKLDGALRQVLALPAVRKNFEDSGITPLGMGAAPFADFLKKEQDKFGAIVAKGKISAE